jgi:chromosome segregation ATPase
LQQLVAALEGEGSPAQRIGNAVKLVAERPTVAAPEPGASLEISNQHFIVYYSNLIQFLDQLANSRDVQSWFIDSSREEDFRPQLIAQFGRLDSFLKQNGLDVDTGELCHNFTEIPAVLSGLVEDIQPQSRELLLVIQTIGLANEVLRKRSEFLADESRRLSAEVQDFRRQLKQANDEMDEHIEEATFSLSSELQEERTKCTSAERMLRALRRELKHSEESGETVTRCMSILSEETPALDESSAVSIEGQLAALVNERDAAFEKISTLHERLRQRKQQLKVVSDADGDRGLKLVQLQNEVEDLRSQNAALQADIAKYSEANEELREARDKQGETIRLVQTDHERTVTQIRAENDQMIAEKATEIEEVQQQLRDIQAQFEEEKRTLRRELKREARKVKGELDLQMQRTEELRNHYEPILTDLRAKLADARAAEGKAQGELQRAELTAKELLTEISAARIDLKMQHLRLKAMEEKGERDQKLAETRFRMKFLGAETAHQAALETMQANYEEKQHHFMVSVCERFKEFVDFAAPISEESIQATLDQVLGAFRLAGKRSRESEQSMNELVEIRTLIGVDRDIPLVKCIAGIVKDSREYQQVRQQIENDQKEAAELLRQGRTAQDSFATSREWETWARRVHGLVTDSFTTAKSPRELQLALEETVLSSLSQRQMKRRLEILRMEKILLVRGMIKPHLSPRKPASLTPLICAAMALHRLRKLSGHLPTNLTSFARAADRSPLPEKRFPVLNVLV